MKTRLRWILLAVIIATLLAFFACLWANGQDYFGTRWNQVTLDMTKAQVRKLLGDPFWTFILPDTKEELCFYERSSHIPFSLASSFPFVVQNPAWFEPGARILFSPQGKVVWKARGKEVVIRAEVNRRLEVIQLPPEYKSEPVPPKMPWPKQDLPLQPLMPEEI